MSQNLKGRKKHTVTGNVSEIKKQENGLNQSRPIQTKESFLTKLIKKISGK